MNRTLEIEQAYYKALGIETTVYESEEYECLIDSKGKEWKGILFSSSTGFSIMQSEKINVEFFSRGVMAWHPDGGPAHHEYYGPEQWKSDLWTLNAAIVIAATDKLERARK